MKPFSFPVLVIVFLSLIIPIQSAYTADPPANSGFPQNFPTAEVIKARIKEVEGKVDLAKTNKDKLTQSYQTTLSNLKKTQTNKRVAEELFKARNNATKQTQTIRNKLKQATVTSSPDVKLNITQKTTLAELKQLLLLEETNLAAKHTNLSGLRGKLMGMRNPAMIQERLVQEKERQKIIFEEIKMPASKTESSLETEARQWMLTTEKLAKRTEIEALNQELFSHPMRLELLNAQIEQTNLEIQPIKNRVHKLQELVNERHLAQAEKTEIEAQVTQQEAKGKHPLIQKMAEQNTSLSQETYLLAISLEEFTDKKKDVINERERLQYSFQISQQRIEASGISQAFSKAFIEQYKTLQKFTGIADEAESLEKEIARINLNRFQYDDERVLLKNIPDYLAKLTANISSEEFQRIREELKQFAEERLKLLSQALLTQQANLQVLNELDLSNRELLKTVTEYSDFLSKYLIWVRNDTIPKLDGLKSIPDTILWMVSPANWNEAFEILKFQSSHSLTFIPLSTLAVIILFGMKYLRNILARTNREVGQPASDRFIFTLQSLALVLMIASPLPVILTLIGWQLNLPESSVFTQAISSTLLRLAPILYFLQICRVLTIDNGFAAVHMGWTVSTLYKLRLELRWFMTTFLPFFFIGSISVFNDYDDLGGELARVSIMALSIALTVLFYRLFKPSYGLLSGFLAQYPGSLLKRFHHLWFAIVVALPLLMMTLTFSGYTFSAAILFGRLYRTIGLVASAVIIYFLITRWVLLVFSRKGSTQSPENEKLDVSNIILSKENQKLIINVVTVAGIIGLWIIWADLLPALGILDNVTMWYHTKVVSGTEINLPVTLGDTILAVIIISLTLIGLKPLSSFFDIIFLQWSSIWPGTRYAIITLSGYVILTIVTAYVFSLLGGSWQEIQWIFAALGVGIGFGLQEIVANFICGIIILFERPVRIGDVVTIGDIDGTISRIQIRSTTVTTFDRKELLVPNKEFITGRLINWSLSDPITRIIISLQVPYGSDLKKTMSIMSKVAVENEQILESPVPHVTIEGFVDNNLKLNLHCYTSSIQHRLQAITSLHEKIIQKFKEEGIVVSSPQRDLQLSTSKALQISLKQDGKSQDTKNN